MKRSPQREIRIAKFLIDQRREALLIGFSIETSGDRVGSVDIRIAIPAPCRAQTSSFKWTCDPLLYNTGSRKAPARFAEEMALTRNQRQQLVGKPGRDLLISRATQVGFPRRGPRSASPP
jgi:hypothetical protein